MAKALVCNSCAAKGTPAFATLHAEGKVGIGKGGRQFEADFCEEHGHIFTELVGSGVTGTTRAQRGPRIATRDDIKRPMLALIAHAPKPVAGPAIFGNAKLPGPLGTRRKVLKALRAEGLVHMEGTKGRARYTLTRKGRNWLRPNRKGKKKAPVATATEAPSAQRAARRLRRPRRGHRG
jgi:hypothetical protein